MTRIGINPARHRVSSYRPAEITLTILTYIPHQEGYFKDRLDVVKLCFASLLKNTTVPYDLLVFDNGSCEPVIEYLHALRESGEVQYLLLSSQNIGKLGALRLIGDLAPGRWIAYADDDTFFYPGWLEKHMQLMRGYPSVGMVSGSPEKTLFDHGIDSNLALAAQSPEVSLQRGHTIPLEWEREWATALGYEVEDFLRRVEQLEDIMLDKGGLRAYATACHNQFVISKATLQQHIGSEWSGRLMGGLNELDNAIDQGGHLRLTTVDRSTRLIGNVLSEEILAEARDMGISIDARAHRRAAAKSRGMMHRMAKFRPLRWLLQGVYNRLFWILTDQSGGWLAEGDSTEG